MDIFLKQHFTRESNYRIKMTYKEKNMKLQGQIDFKDADRREL
jgi:hypothetical protein